MSLSHLTVAGMVRQELKSKATKNIIIFPLVLNSSTLNDHMNSNKINERDRRLEEKN